MDYYCEMDFFEEMTIMLEVKIDSYNEQVADGTLVPTHEEIAKHKCNCDDLATRRVVLAHKRQQYMDALARGV